MVYHAVIGDRIMYYGMNDAGLFVWYYADDVIVVKVTKNEA